MLCNTYITMKNRFKQFDLISSTLRGKTSVLSVGLLFLLLRISLVLAQNPESSSLPSQISSSAKPLINMEQPFGGASNENDTSKSMAENGTLQISTKVVYVTQPTKAGSMECQLSAVDPFLHTKIRNRIDHEKVNLIEYHFTFPNYSYNPLTTNVSYAYRPNSWARVSTRHGQTLLSLAFNYGVLSLMTLTFGTERMEIELMDEPPGCITWERSEEEKLNLLLYPMVRDFQDTEEIALTQDERVCVEMIEEKYPGYATVRDRCYMKDIAGELVITGTGNMWITFLYFMMTAIRIGILFFGPMLLIPAVARMSNKNVPYLVCLKEPIYQTIKLVKTSREAVKNAKAKNILDLSTVRGFPKLKSLAAKYPFDFPLKVVIDKYDIFVNYSRLIPENEVPVGFWKSIMDAIFLCTIQDTWPFRDCCETRIFDKSRDGCRKSTWNVQWIKFWKPVGLLLLVAFIPIPYYIRLVIFYRCEEDEVVQRKEAIANVGLKETFENSVVHYLTPTHPLFVACYILYGLTVICMAVVARHGDDGRFKNIITGAFQDLKSLSWVKILQLATRNVIWPFKQYGMHGCLVALIYLPIMLPLTLAIYGLYALPTFYVATRMFFHSRRAFVDSVRKKPGIHRYKVTPPVDTNLKKFLFEKHFDKYFNKKKRELKGRQRVLSQKDAENCDEMTPNLEDLSISRASFRPKRNSLSTITETSVIVDKRSCCQEPLKTIAYLVAAGLSVSTLLACLFLVSECIGCFVEMMVFTLMGIIVNAGALLKYVSLGVLVIAYSFDCFNNVKKKYLKLNKALFSEVKVRIKDLEKVTSQPSNLQENIGFKSQEQSEQGKHESPDELAKHPLRLWKINDLTLFVDSLDQPRVPRRLFDEVCKIRVAGVPGPVYRGLLQGLVQFLKIIVFIAFVFIVVLSFGEVYKVSSTNQMLATMAGGFLPVILRQFMQPDRPDIEIGTVSFKTKLDETIKNFWQYWPLYDFQFQIHVEPEEGQESGESNGNDSSNRGGANNAGPPKNNTLPTVTVSYDRTLPNNNLNGRPIDNADVSTMQGSMATLGDAEGVGLGISPRLPTYSQATQDAGEYQNPATGSNSRSDFELKPCGRPQNNFARKSQEAEPKKSPSSLGSFSDQFSGIDVEKRENEEEIPNEVDLCIILPTTNDDRWLDEWSGISQYTHTSKPEEKESVRAKVAQL